MIDNFLKNKKSYWQDRFLGCTRFLCRSDSANQNQCLLPAKKRQKRSIKEKM